MGSKKVGLAAIREHQAALAAKAEKASQPKTQYLAIKPGKSVKLRPLQELDKGSPNYSEKNGLGMAVIEHNHPVEYWRSARCSIEEEGRCWACEQHMKDYKAGWGQKTRVYINVLVNEPDPDKEPYVAVLSQTMSQVPAVLIEYAEEEPHTITNRWYKVTRQGEKKATVYITMAQPEDDSIDPEDYEVFDLDRVIRQIPYDQQAAHYLGGQAPAADEMEGLETFARGPALVSATSEEVPW